jgi:ketosteroid isomerase-like protein
VQRSTGIYDLAQAFAESIRQRDLAALTALIADDEHLLFIGTDPEEWWTGRDTLIAVYEQQLAAMEPGGPGLTEFDVTAYEQGDSGWFAGRTSLVSEGERVPVRISGAARRRGGQWKIVHLHVSIGLPNEQIAGQLVPS